MEPSNTANIAWGEPYVANTITAASYTLYTAPKIVGSYQLGGKFGLCIGLLKKPNWFHRHMMYFCFGWVWVDG